MSERKRINQLFNQSFNCAQIVFSEFGPTFGLKREDCLRIASGFGAGMSTMQEVCGAVTGAIMVLGMKYGNSRENDKEAKEKTYKMVKEFAARFKKKNQSINCRKLINIDITTPEGLQKARDLKIFETKCPQFVQDAIDILRELLN
jgi:C_GCAxxG_C_C family probable redox protein